jgi:hypothetical protein
VDYKDGWLLMCGVLCSISNSAPAYISGVKREQGRRQAGMTGNHKALVCYMTVHFALKGTVVLVAIRLTGSSLAIGKKREQAPKTRKEIETSLADAGPSSVELCIPT